jgi:hypothetical protein
MSMRQFLLYLVIAIAVLCSAAPASHAGPHGCYRSHGCH